MPGRQHRYAVALCVGVLLSCLSLAGCKHARPENVPVDSVYVDAPWAEGWWQHCSYLATQAIDHCQTFNWGGGTIKDEEFIPYDGGTAAKESELTIDNGARLAGPYIVCLKNGRILIPKSDFENQKRFIDWMTGKSKTR